MLPPLLLLGVLAGPPAACVDDFGCSLNGVCAGGRCRCDAAWRGARCGALNLLPAKPRNGYGGLNSTTSSWGGGAAFDPATGKYGMVVSEFDRHCGLVSYHHNSRCVLAEADSPSGPYEPVAVLVDANCMGTTTARDPRTGAWLFSGYHVNQSECLLCSGGVTPDLPKHAEGKAGPCSRGVGAVDTKNALLARSGSRGPWRDAGPGVPNVGADVPTRGIFSIRRSSDVQPVHGRRCGHPRCCCRRCCCPGCWLRLARHERCHEKSSAATPFWA